MLSAKQKEQVAVKVNHYVDLANTRLGATMSIPTILYSLKGTTAGTARGDYELNFNAQLLEDNWELYFEDTIPHEVAHLIDKNLNGTQYKYTRRGPQRVSHGVTWKNIMIQLGGDPKRTHNMDVTKTAKHKRKFMYTCDCCNKELVLTSVRHNKLLRNSAQYSHCRGFNLTYKNELGKVSFNEALQMKNTKPAPKATKPATKPATKAPVKKPAATKRTVKAKAPKKGTVILKAVNAYKKAMRANMDITRQEMITVLVKEFGLTNDKPGRVKAAGYFQNAKKVVEA